MDSIRIVVPLWVIVGLLAGIVGLGLVSTYLVPAPTEEEPPVISAYSGESAVEYGIKYVYKHRQPLNIDLDADADTTIGLSWRINEVNGYFVDEGNLKGWRNGTGTVEEFLASTNIKIIRVAWDSVTFSASATDTLRFIGEALGY